jgi:hypothetical protein
MSGMVSETDDVKNDIQAIKNAWDKSGFIYSLFKRKKQTAILIDSLRARLSLTPTETARLLANTPSETGYKKLVRFTLDHYSWKLTQLMQDIDWSLHGAETPLSIKIALEKINRKENDCYPFQEVDPLAQVISLHLEAAVLLLAAEETRWEVTIWRNGFLERERGGACWRLASERAKKLVNAAASLCEKLPQSDVRIFWLSNGARVVERADKVLAVTSEEAHNDPRYQHRVMRFNGSYLPPDDTTWGLTQFQKDTGKLKRVLETLGIEQTLKAFLIDVTI